MADAYDFLVRNRNPALIARSFISLDHGFGRAKQGPLDTHPSFYTDILRCADMDTLKTRLISIGVENYESKWYIPEPELEQLFNEENVREAITESGLELYKQEEVVQTILHGGKKVFAVLIQIGDTSSIVKFMERDHLQIQPLDAKFPFTRPDVVSILGQSQGELFYRTQWTFLAPLFRGDLSHRNFDKATVLPFIRNSKIGCGAFGTVYEVVLDSRQQTDTTSAQLPTDLKIIRKEMDLPLAVENLATTLDSRDAVEREGHVLSFLRLVRHPNIVRLIASYSYRGTYNLLFERAESDLGVLLSRPQRPPALQSDASFYQAMQGLCEALATFHHLTYPGYGLELKGYHHDLKPENILVDGSRFLLSDFGLSSLKEMSAKSKSLSKDVIGYYISPECETIEDGFSPKMIGQPSDVWALGCILAVLLTYIQRGTQGVAEFEQRRRYKAQNWTTYTFHCGGATNPAVDTWLTELEEQASSEAVGLVRLIRDIVKINPSDRPVAKTVSSRMDFLAAKSIYRATTRIFDRVAEAFSDPLVSIERERVTLFGEAVKFDSTSYEWRNIPGILTPKVEFKTFQGHLLDLRQGLEILDPYSDRGSFPRLILKQIRSSIDQLWNLLSPVVKSKLENTLEARLVSTEDLTVLDAVQSRFKEDPGYKNIGLVAAIRSMVLLADRGEVKNLKLQVDPSLVTVTGPEITPFSSLAEKRESDQDAGKEVLVEWMEYDARWQESTGRELFMRVEAIAEILHDEEKPTNFRALRCTSFFHSVSRHSFGLIFDLPSPRGVEKLLQEQRHPISLADLIQSTRKRKERPDLGHIFKLAEVLAASVLEWHKVGWVHRGISALSIIFFDIVPGLSFQSITEPFFLGFQYSRPNEPNSFTLGPPDKPELMDYCHPEYLKGSTRHLPEFDYYSLGLVLLEIGYWRTLRSMVSQFTDEDQSPENLRRWLLEKPVQGLHMVMGGVYQEVVRTCLTFHSESSLTQNHLIRVGILEVFEEKVLAKVRLCFA